MPSDFKIDGNYIVYSPGSSGATKGEGSSGSQYREKANDKYLKIYFSDSESVGVFQKQVAKVILILQAYKLKKKAERSRKCKVDISRFIKFYEEDYCVSESESVNPEEFESYEAGSNNEKGSILSKQPKLKANESGNIGSINQKVANSSVIKNEAEKEFEEFENEEDSDGDEQKTIYDMINEKVNKKVSIKWPKSRKDRIMYILLSPLTIPTYFTIPNPMVEGRQSFYPLTLFLSCVWIYLYTFIIVWWSYKLSEAWKINLSIIPLIIYPLGISIRDRKKISDFVKVKELFAEKLPDQVISLAETFSGPIFQITGLMGFTWVIRILMSGDQVSFENPNIQYQAPLLLICGVVKYISLLICKFKTRKGLFVFNLAVYIGFTFAALMIDYYDEF